MGPPIRGYRRRGRCRRIRRSVTPRSSGPAGPARSRPDCGATRAGPTCRRSSAAWTTTAPSVAPPDAFRAGLTTHRNPSLLAPLGHLVDPDGPSGVVGGLADAAPGEPLSYSAGVELRVPEPAGQHVDRPSVQRRVESMAAAPPVTDPRLADLSVPAPSVAEPAVAGPPVADDDHRDQEPPAAPVLGESLLGETAAAARSDPAPTVESRHHDHQPLTVAREVDRSSSGSVASHPIALQRLADEPTPVVRPSASAAEPSVAPPAPVESALPTVGEVARVDVDRRVPSPVVPQPSPVVPQASPVVPQAGPVVPQASPVVPQAGPVVPQASPVVPQASPGATLPTVAAAIPVQRQASGSAGTTSAAAEPGAPRSSGRSDSGSDRRAESIPLTVSRLAARSESPVTTTRVVESPAPTNGSDQTRSRNPPTCRPSHHLRPRRRASRKSLLTCRRGDGPTAARGAGAPSTSDEPTVARLLADRPVLDEPATHAEDAEPVAEIARRTAAGAMLPVPGRPNDPGDLVGRPVPAVTATPVTDTPVTGKPVQRQLAPPTSGPIRPTIAGEPQIAGADAAHPVPAVTDGTIAAESPTSEKGPGAEAEYPPMIQRRVASSSPVSTADESPLSGFAAAITALHQDPDDDERSAASDTLAAPSGDGAASAAFGGPGLVVARQVVESATAGPPSALGDAVPAAATGLRSIGIPVSAPPTPTPMLVVARRIAPDATGALPPADVRLPLPTPRPFVQRRLLSEQPVPTGLPAAVPPLPPPAGTAAVQRVRYEDVPAAAPAHAMPIAASLADIPDRDVVASPGAAPMPAPSTASGSIGAWQTPSAAHVVQPSPPAPLAPVQRRSAGEGMPESVAAVRPTPTPTAPARRPGTSDADRTAAPRAVRPAIDRSSAEQRTGLRTGARTQAGPSRTATSTRTVGLVEMFALASGGADNPGEAGGSVVQRSVAGSPPAATEVQLAPSDAPAPSSASAPAGGGAAAPGGAPASGTDIEEMALRLYEPLTARLRAELWQDRERAGLLTDLRP